MLKTPNNDNGTPQKTLLILGNNPKGTSRIRLDEEVREICMGLQRSKNRESFAIYHQWAVRPRDLHRALLDYRPQIVHFCGHGEGHKGLVFEDEYGHPKLINAAALSNLFRLFSYCIECIILNACYSEIQAGKISQYIDYVIGMQESLGDNAAIDFSVGFYDAIGAGKSYGFAFDIGCAAVEVTGIYDHFFPIIQKRAMPISDKEIRNIIDGICRTSQPMSSEYRRYTNRLLIGLQQIPNLLKSSHPYYLEALDKTWEWVVDHICEFQPQSHLSLQDSLVRWINKYLSWRIKDLHRKDQRQHCNEVSLDASGNFNVPYLSDIDSYIENERVERNQKIWNKIEKYIEEDPDNRFRSCHVKNHPRCNCQTLCQKLILKHPPDKFSKVSRDLNINYQTLKSHWERKCKPLLQSIAEEFGYSQGEES